MLDITLASTYSLLSSVVESVKTLLEYILQFQEDDFLLSSSSNSKIKVNKTKSENNPFKVKPIKLKASCAVN